MKLKTIAFILGFVGIIGILNINFTPPHPSSTPLEVKYMSFFFVTLILISLIIEYIIMRRERKQGKSWKEILWNK